MKNPSKGLTQLAVWHPPAAACTLQCLWKGLAVHMGVLTGWRLAVGLMNADEQ